MDSTSEKYSRDGVFQGYPTRVGMLNTKVLNTIFSIAPIRGNFEGMGPRGSFCFDTKCEDIRISAAANQRPPCEQSAEDCALVGGGSGTKASSHPTPAAYQHPVHTLVVNVTTAAMAAFVAAAPQLAARAAVSR